MNGTDLVTFSGGPYLKPLRYGWTYKYDYLKNQTADILTLKNYEITLSSYLRNIN